MDRYGHIFTIFTDTNISTDIDIQTDMDRYEQYSHIQTNRYGQIYTIFTDMNIWTDIDILTDIDVYEQILKYELIQWYLHIDRYQHILTNINNMNRCEDIHTYADCQQHTYACIWADIYRYREIFTH